MYFADIHSHMLFGCDDGAKNESDMMSLVRAAYDGGTRLLCLTPHFFPAFFGNNRDKSELAFAALAEKCKNELPDLQLVLGNELAYRHDCIAWLRDGACRTMGDTNYVLVEFSVRNSEDFIAEGIYRLQNAGYTPIIAHAERYKALTKGRVWSFRQNGVLIQINSKSLSEKGEFFQKYRMKRLLSEGFVDFVSSDAHDMKTRTPTMTAEYELFTQKYGRDYADSVFYKNAQKIFGKSKESEGVSK